MKRESKYRGWVIRQSPYGWIIFRPGEHLAFSSQPSMEFAKRFVDEQIKADNVSEFKHER